MQARTAVTVVCLCAAAVRPAAGQRLLEEWRVRTTAGPEALVAGATAVFWNPAQVHLPDRRGEIVVLDLRAPRITGVDGLAAAGSFALADGRTTIAVGYEHMGVSGIERTGSTPESEGTVDVAENRLAAAAAHTLSDRFRIGALVQYTRLPEVSADESVIALGVGVRFTPSDRLPLQLAGVGAFEGNDAYWYAGADMALPWHVQDWRFGGEYGVGGGQLAPGITHRLAAAADWRDVANLMLGLAVEPDGTGHTIQPVASAALRLNRYRLGVVREQLANGFGGAYSFRFSVGF